MSASHVLKTEIFPLRDRKNRQLKTSAHPWCSCQLLRRLNILHRMMEARKKMEQERRAMERSRDKNGGRGYGFTK